MLSRVFRGKFVAGLRRLFARDQLRFFGECVPLHNQKRFTIFLRTLYRQDWVVYAKPPFGGPEHHDEVWGCIYGRKTESTRCGCTDGTTRENQRKRRNFVCFCLVCGCVGFWEQEV